MVLNQKKIKELKAYIGVQGAGSKKKLAELLDIQQSQVSALLATGSIPKAKFEQIKEIIKTKPDLNKEVECD
jgi:predicted XRE-type DNA-binding protein